MPPATAAAAVTSAAGVAVAAHGGVGERQAGGAAADSLGVQDTFSSCPPPRGGSVMALKRLLREVFADMVVMRQKLEDLTPKADADDLVIPHEGSGIAPAQRPLAPGVRHKAQVQLSGELLCAGAAPWAQGGSSTSGSQGWLSAQLAAAGLQVGGAAVLRLLLQSMWTTPAVQSLTARLACSPQPSPPGCLGASASNTMAGSLGMLPTSPLPPAMQQEPGEVPGLGVWGAGPVPGLTVDQLLWRREVKMGAARPAPASSPSSSSPSVPPDAQSATGLVEPNQAHQPNQAPGSVSAKRAY
ncbi:hypothetical protein V8C86DRAFT_2912345 [Haematococcus lacustris]